MPVAFAFSERVCQLTDCSWEFLSLLKKRARARGTLWHQNRYARDVRLFQKLPSLFCNFGAERSKFYCLYQRKSLIWVIPQKVYVSKLLSLVDRVLLVEFKLMV
jgi:hypothetical protein